MLSLHLEFQIGYKIAGNFSNAPFFITNILSGGEGAVE